MTDTDRVDEALRQFFDALAQMEQLDAHGTLCGLSRLLRHKIAAARRAECGGCRQAARAALEELVEAWAQDQRVH